MSENPYKILGIAEDATTEEIRAAWKKKAAATHPDKEGGNAAEFARAAKAFEDLAKRREEIDRELKENRVREAAAKAAQEARRLEEEAPRKTYEPHQGESSLSEEVFAQVATATRLVTSVAKEAKQRFMSAPKAAGTSSLSAKEHELDILPCSDGNCSACFGVGSPGL